ncbi:hypothetical protein [Frigoribacterium sp. MEB024]|uniref:hypothetical protein n=1 Tax=Frigoribacterium sp. MEB024 TaxID=1589899 RepID=UPI001E444FF8|nr:hypothetical protein [Frigoribacterium sp. MEB024]
MAGEREVCRCGSVVLGVQRDRGSGGVVALAGLAGLEDVLAVVDVGGADGPLAVGEHLGAAQDGAAALFADGDLGADLTGAAEGDRTAVVGHALGRSGDRDAGAVGDGDDDLTVGFAVDLLVDADVVVAARVGGADRGRPGTRAEASLGAGDLVTVDVADHDGGAGVGRAGQDGVLLEVGGERHGAADGRHVEDDVEGGLAGLDGALVLLEGDPVRPELQLGEFVGPLAVGTGRDLVLTVDHDERVRDRAARDPSGPVREVRRIHLARELAESRDVGLEGEGARRREGEVVSPVATDRIGRPECVPQGRTVEEPLG